MPVPTVWAIRTESQLVHVTLFDVIEGVLVYTVLLTTLAMEAEEAADGHPCLVVLVEKSAGLSLHAQAPKPVPAHRLPEAAAWAAASGGGVGGCGARRSRVTGGGVGGNDERCGGRRRICGAHIEAALEIEAEISVCIFHWNRFRQIFLQRKKNESRYNSIKKKNRKSGLIWFGETLIRCGGVLFQIPI